MKDREFQIFVKPVGASCNLNCSYCYYLDKKDLYSGENPVIMTDDILEKYILQHIEASTGKIINFSWHGGEPLLAGIEFYKKALRLQKKYKPEGSTIINGIQTNGTLLDEKFCRFLSDAGFVTGVSIDGPAFLHNQNRRTNRDDNTFLNVIRGYELLQRHGVIPEILCVVNSENVLYPHDIYKFFKELRAKYITFLPLVEQDPLSASGVSENSVPAEEFGYFLAEIFDQWAENDIGEIKIQIFEEALRSAFDQDHTLCIFKKDCGGVPVVEHNGDFYCCDHYVDKNHFPGNIKEHSLTYFLDSERQESFGKAKSWGLPEYCLECTVRTMCNGECPKNRFICTPDGEYGLNYLCAGYKYFFNHCRPFVNAVAETWKKQEG